jgi:hypothetical protein
MAKIAHFSVNARGRLVGRELVPGGDEPDELGSRADAQLLKNAAQVMINGSRTDEELGGGGAIRSALTHDARNLQLLARQLIEAAHVALARGLARGTQLAPRTLRPQPGAQPFERFEGGPKWLAGVYATSLAPQILAVQERGPRPFEWPIRGCVRSKSLVEQNVRFVSSSEERP